MLVEISRLFDVLLERAFLTDRGLVRALIDWSASLREDAERDSIFGELAIRIARVRMVEDAEALARRINSSHERSQYLRQVAESELSVGERARAIALLREAITVAEALPPDWYWERAEVLAHIAKVLYQADEKEAAVEQWNVAISVARSGEAADPNSIDCSAVLWTISRMLAGAGMTEQAQVVAQAIRDDQRREGALHDLEKARG
jgi:tetratricopeptide (TPR) repeat protein